MSDFPPPPPPPPPPGGRPPPPPPPPGGYGSYGDSSSGAPAGKTDALGRPLAEWWQRVAAVFIDGLLLFIPTLVAFVVVASATTDFVGAVAALAVSTVYYASLNGGESGQTIGKKGLGIQVRDAAGHAPIGTQRGAIRYLVDGVISLAPVLVLFGIVDALWPLWDPMRQALHDKIVGSVVVKVPVPGPVYE